MSDYTSLTNLRFEFLNDVHARWLPITGPNFGLCLSEDPSTDMVQGYIDSCEARSLGGIARIVTHMDTLGANDDDKTGIVRILTGDEFQGTPLFTLPDLDNFDATAGYGSALHVYDDWAKHIPTGKSSEVVTQIMTIGNHEFDVGVDVFNNYLADIQSLGAVSICANCKFDDQACSVDNTLLKPYHIVENMFAGGKKVGFWGMVVPELKNISNLPEPCLVASHEDMKSEFEAFLKLVDHAVVVSHMGIEDDIKFTRVLETLPQSEKDKVLGIFGGHSHSVPCGINGLPHTSGVVQTAPSLGDAGKVNCTNGKNFDKLTLAAWDDTGYTADGENKWINWPTRNAGIDIYHSGMHSWMYASLKLDDAGAVVAQHDIMSPSIPLDRAIIEKQKVELTSLSLAQEDKIAIARGSLNQGDCKIGHTGCDAGSFFATTMLTAASVYAFPEVVDDVADLDDMVFAGSISGGGSIRATLPNGYLSWIDINTSFPFLNHLVGGTVTGETIIRNMLHGAFGLEGAQMGGMRIVHSEDFDVDAYVAEVSDVAAAAGLTRATYFCAAEDGALPLSSFDGSHPLDGGSVEYPSAMIKRLMKSSRTITESARPRTIASGEGCSNSGNPLSFEINGCLIKHFRAVRAGTEEAVDYFPHSSVNDCECWEEIDPTKEYFFATTDYQANGGDNYCFDFIKRFDYQADYDGELGCTGFAMDFIDNYQKNLYPHRNNWQFVSEPSGAVTPKSPDKATSAIIGAIGFLAIAMMY